ANRRGATSRCHSSCSFPPPSTMGPTSVSARCPGTSPGTHPRLEPAAVLADRAREPRLPDEFRMETDDLREPSPSTGQAQDRVREALAGERVASEHVAGFVGQ